MVVDFTGDRQSYRHEYSAGRIFAVFGSYNFDVVIKCGTQYVWIMRDSKLKLETRNVRYKIHINVGKFLNVGKQIK